MSVARFERTEFNDYQVVDTRDGEIVKRNLKKIKKAAAYVTYYNEEIAKAEKLIAKMDEIWSNK